MFFVESFAQNLTFGELRPWVFLVASVAGLAQPVAQIALPVALFFSLARSAKKIDLVKTRLPKFCPRGLILGKRKKKCEIFQNFVGSVMAFSGILDKNNWFKYKKIACGVLFL